jgi:hypothetical protein
MKNKPILCLDFDGVLHSYTSGWKGATVIPDPPVPGALEFVVGALERFQVAILSSRSHQWFGRYAMKRWLRAHLIAASGRTYGTTPEWLRRKVAESAFADPWADEVRYAVDCIVKAIQWPLHKPPAMLTIDDRALTFTGEWPELADLRAFQPWNKRKAA